MKLTGADATTRAGQHLARFVKTGDAIALVGELGTGKSTFVAGLAAALGAGGAHSPTFSLVHEYPGRIAIWHVDLYRVEREPELRELGLEDMDGLLVVEWADRFDVMPADHLRIELTHAGDARELAATGTGPRGRALAEAMLGFPG